MFHLIGISCFRLKYAMSKIHCPKMFCFLNGVWGVFGTQVYKRTNNECIFINKFNVLFSFKILKNWVVKLVFI